MQAGGMIFCTVDASLERGSTSLRELSSSRAKRLRVQSSAGGLRGPGRLRALHICEATPFTAHARLVRRTCYWQPTATCPSRGGLGKGASRKRTRLARPQPECGLALR